MTLILCVCSQETKWADFSSCSVWFCQASRPYFISTRPVSILSFDKFEENSCFPQCKYGKEGAETRHLLFIMSHSSYTMSCIKQSWDGGSVIMHIFTGRETKIRLRGKAEIEMRCWESKSSALFAMSHSLLHSACINRAWQSLKCCWVYPYNASMKYWCFAYTGGILKQICVYVLKEHEKELHTHTQTKGWRSILLNLIHWGKRKLA